MEKEIEIGQTWPEANKTVWESILSSNYHFSLTPVHSILLILMLDLKWFFYIVIRVTIKECNTMPVCGIGCTLFRKKTFQSTIIIHSLLHMQVKEFATTLLAHWLSVCPSDCPSVVLILLSPYSNCQSRCHHTPTYLELKSLQGFCLLQGTFLLDQYQCLTATDEPLWPPAGPPSIMWVKCMEIREWQCHRYAKNRTTFIFCVDRWMLRSGTVSKPFYLKLFEKWP